MRRALLLIGIALPAHAAAAAGAVVAEARVEWKHEAEPRVIVGDTVWRCAGEICRGRVIDTPLLKHRACRAIARYAGGVTSFATSSGPLAAEDLARCNGGRR